jgi:release factor glutamine methyltransferase
MSLAIGSSVTSGAQLLGAAGVNQARMEAASLLALVLNQDRTFVITHTHDELTQAQIERFQSLLNRRAQGEPLQYITGRQHFFRLEFEVTPDVLIPRPETELIVEAGLELLLGSDRPSIADIGTGSGCIAISLLNELPDARAVATDVCPPALVVAERNARWHGVADRLMLIESDCFSAPQSVGPFNLIASNPPYIADHEIESLQREVLREPHNALFAGEDGLEVIRRLLREAPAHLWSGGHFVFEIGFGQSEAIQGFIDADVWQLREIRADLQRIPRTVVLRKK